MDLLNIKASENISPNEISDSKIDYTIKDSFKHVSQVIENCNFNKNLIEEHEEIIKKCQIIIGELKNREETSNQHQLDSTRMVFEQLYGSFTIGVSLQGQENEKMLKKIDKLKKEKSALQDKIINLARLCSLLEDELGSYPVQIKK